MIRAASPDDAAAIQAIYAPIVRDTAISFEIDVPTVEEMAGRIAATLPAYPYLVAERAGRVAGYAYASAHKTRAAYAISAETTVYVDAAARGSGIGRALYGKLLGELEGRRFHSAVAGITLPNAPSVKLHEAAGFLPVGVFVEVGRKFGRYHDVGWWQCRLASRLQPRASDARITT